MEAFIEIVCVFLQTLKEHIADISTHLSFSYLWLKLKITAQSHVNVYIWNVSTLKDDYYSKNIAVAHKNIDHFIVEKKEKKKILLLWNIS